MKYAKKNMYNVQGELCCKIKIKLRNISKEFCLKFIHKIINMYICTFIMLALKPSLTF